MKNFFKNLFNNGYKYHKDVVIIACYYNPSKNQLRTSAFKEWYESIKHLEHRIIECSINGSDWEIPLNDNIIRVNTFSNLWHKETLLNKVINTLDENKYKYVFWMDCDVILENKNWLVDSVKEFEKGCTVIQPFSQCKHLTPNDEDRYIEYYKNLFLSNDCIKDNARNKRIWDSFASVYNNNSNRFYSNDYDLHGHVGFIWGARLDNLKKCPLFEKGLIGGSDHIMAHATTGQFYERDILDVYKDNIDEVKSFMRLWNLYHNKLSYVEGNLYHIYHGELEKRDYYKRIKNFTPFTKEISTKDENGFYVPTEQAKSYYDEYYKNRETVVENILDDIIFQEIIEDFDEKYDTSFEFGGGDFGGGGAEGSYEQNFS